MTASTLASAAQDKMYAVEVYIVHAGTMDFHESHMNMTLAKATKLDNEMSGLPGIFTQIVPDDQGDSSMDFDDCSEF